MRTSSHLHLIWMGVFVAFVVLSFEPFMVFLNQMFGNSSADIELQYFLAFRDLTKKIHHMMDADDVLQAVCDCLQDRVQIRKLTVMVNRALLTEESDIKVISGDEESCLVPWSRESKGKVLEIRDATFKSFVQQQEELITYEKANLAVREVMQETGSSLLIPVRQDKKLLCMIFMGRTDSRYAFSEIELQAFDFLADQLGIVLDRIRIYRKVMEKTHMDHQQKMQVMQNLSSNIAHEMRTPLSGIRASISGVESYLGDLVNVYEQARHYGVEQVPVIRDTHLQSLRSTPDRIKLMIDQANNVIDMLLMNLRNTSLDNTQLNICNVRECIEQAIDRYPFKSGELELVHLELDEDFNFLGIESLFVYIIFNLVKNALYSIKSAQKGEISITLKRSETTNYIHFRDTGMGIEKEVQGKIFEGFFTTKEDGTGAGLAYCKRTIESFGGDISCSSIPDQYTDFILSFPVLIESPEKAMLH